MSPDSIIIQSQPSNRVMSKTGLDYLGPMYIKTTDGVTKVWVCLFACFVTRAVYLELILDMSTEQFLLCLRCFISQRGTPIEVISDNATQLKATTAALDRIGCNLIHSDIASSKNNWIFIIEYAPWMGGFYERRVSLVKRVFRKTIGRKLLTLFQLQTLLKETESVINTRPLVYVGGQHNINTRTF